MRPFFISATLGLLMILSAVSAKVITPTIYLAETLPALVLESEIPSQFGEWREDKEGISPVVNPEAEAVLKKIYAQTLSRTFINASGERIMLAIAYGKDQGDAVQVHYPEVCYPAQGFQLDSIQVGTLETQQGVIPVKRLETNLSRQRYEPVTYWTTVGDVAVTGGLNKKIAEMRYRLHGKIPDGLLFRVSSISNDSQTAFALQESFVRTLIKNLSPESRDRIAGLGTKNK